MASRCARCYVVPTLLALVIVSRLLIPSFTTHAFSVLDADRDGLVTAADLERHYTETLGRQPGMGWEAAETFPGGVSGSLDRRGFRLWWREGPDVYRQSAYFDAGWWRETEYFLGEAVYWVTLGVLSSVGLGTGMHSGLLFLFPHIYLTCAAASSCGNTNFWSYPTNVFFYGPRDRAFVCIKPNPGAPTVSVLLIVCKVLPACVLWGVGTAMGEVPPYALSYAAARQGKRHEELEEKSSYDIVNRMKDWTLHKIQRYGFWAILLLAAWPNMAFDLCGMACGQFLMPFWTFFGATLIGKAFIKVTLQAIFFVSLFSGNNIERLVRRAGAAAADVLPTRLHVDSMVEKAVVGISRARDSIAQRATGGAGEWGGSEGQDSPSAAEAWLPRFLNAFVAVAVAWFVASIIESCAIAEQEHRDDKRLARLAVVLEQRQQHGRNPRPLGDEELLSLLGVPGLQTAAGFNLEGVEGAASQLHDSQRPIELHRRGKWTPLAIIGGLLIVVGVALDESKFLWFGLTLGLQAAILTFAHANALVSADVESAVGCLMLAAACYELVEA